MSTTNSNTPTTARSGTGGRVSARGPGPGGEHRASTPGTSTSVLTRFLAVTGQAVLERWRTSAVIGAAMIAMGLLTGGLWPSLEGTLSDVPDNLTETLAKALSGADLTTAIGWTNAEFLSIVAPLAVIAAAVGAAGRVAGEESTKTLGVLLSAPLARTTFLLAKLTALMVHVVVVATAVTAGLLLGGLLGDLGLTGAGVVGASLHVAALGVFFGALALLVGAATGDARLSLVVTAVVATVSFLATVVLPLFESAASWARLSPWYYYNAGDPLLNGADALHILVLVGAGAVLVVAAVLTYRRRDLRG